MTNKDNTTKSVNKYSGILYIVQLRSGFYNYVRSIIKMSSDWLNFFNTIVYLSFSPIKKQKIYKLSKNTNDGEIYISLSPIVKVSRITDVVRNPILFFKIIAMYIRFIISIIVLVKKFKISLIRSENVLLIGLPAFIASILTRTPYVIWLVGSDRKVLEIKLNDNIIKILVMKLITLLEFLVFKHAKCIYCFSLDLARTAMQRSAKNVSILFPYVDINTFVPINDIPVKKNKVIFLYAGRLEEEKGIKILLKATKMVLKNADNFSLLIAGDGSLSEFVRKYIVSNNLEKYIRLIGFVKKHNMPLIYNMADVVILPSFTEGTPAVILEAMLCGRFVIATPVGMVPFLIRDKENGFLIKIGDPNDLAKKMLYVIYNREKLFNSSKKTRKYAISLINNYYYKQIDSHIKCIRT